MVEDAGMAYSMSGVGHCLGNAPNREAFEYLESEDLLFSSVLGV